MVAGELLLYALYQWFLKQLSLSVPLSDYMAEKFNVNENESSDSLADLVRPLLSACVLGLPYALLHHQFEMRRIAVQLLPCLARCCALFEPHAATLLWPVHSLQMVGPGTHTDIPALRAVTVLQTTDQLVASAAWSAEIVRVTDQLRRSVTEKTLTRRRSSRSMVKTDGAEAEESDLLTRLMTLAKGGTHIPEEDERSLFWEALVTVENVHKRLALRRLERHLVDEGGGGAGRAEYRENAVAFLSPLDGARKVLSQAIQQSITFLVCSHGILFERGLYSVDVAAAVLLSKCYLLSSLPEEDVSVIEVDESNATAVSSMTVSRTSSAAEEYMGGCDGKIDALYHSDGFQADDRTDAWLKCVLLVMWKADLLEPTRRGLVGASDVELFPDGQNIALPSPTVLPSVTVPSTRSHFHERASSFKGFACLDTPPTVGTSTIGRESMWMRSPERRELEQGLRDAMGMDQWLCEAVAHGMLVISRRPLYRHSPPPVGMVVTCVRWRLCCASDPRWLDRKQLSKRTLSESGSLLAELALRYFTGPREDCGCAEVYQTSGRGARTEWNAITCLDLAALALETSSILIASGSSEKKCAAYTLRTSRSLLALSDVLCQRLSDDAASTSSNSVWSKRREQFQEILVAFLSKNTRKCDFEERQLDGRVLVSEVMLDSVVDVDKKVLFPLDGNGARKKEGSKIEAQGRFSDTNQQLAVGEMEGIEERDEFSDWDEDESVSSEDEEDNGLNSSSSFIGVDAGSVMSSRCVAFQDECAQWLAYIKHKL